MPDNTSLHILETRLNRPPVNRKWVSRPRLIGPLNSGLKKRLTLVSAPAGYGKTTLVAQWLENLLQPSAWLTLDENGGDPDRFLKYVIASIRRVFPEFAIDIESLFSSPTLPPPDYLADALISHLIAVKQPLVIVLDDFHLVASEPVKKIVTRLVRFFPDAHHLVLLSRVDPTLPLAKWRVRNWIEEFRAFELRFTREEAQAFFSSFLGNGISAEAVYRIFNHTEGWIAGLQMARLSLADSDNPERLIRSITDSDHLGIDFLMDEVISVQSAEVRDFLTLTALFERFCVPLCNYILERTSGEADSRNLISQIVKENLFLVPLDNEGTWYRYHHLFRNMLIQYLEVGLTRERKARFHQLAAEWFAGQGMIEEALRHFLEAGNLDSAAELFALNLHHIVHNDLSRRTLMRFLAIFPAGAENEQPALLVARACYKTYHWDFPGLLSLLDTAENLLRRPDCGIAEYVQQLLLANIDGMRGFYLYWEGDMENALRHARRALHCIPRKHHWAYTLAILYTAGSLAATGRRGEALRFLSDKESEDCSAGSLNVGTILAAKAAIHCYEANLDAVREVGERVLERHKTVPVPDYWLSHAYCFLGSVAYERNLLNSAANYFSRVEQMIYRVNTRMYHECLVGMALTAWAANASEKAWEYAEKARSWAVKMNDAISLQISDSLYSRLTLFAGKVLAEPATISFSNDANKFWLELPSLTQAEYLIKRASKNCRSIIPLIENACKRAADYHNSRQVIQFLSVKAVALTCAGEPNAALEVLEETLAMAEPHGFVRTFVDRGPVLAGLLRDLSAKRSESPYIRLLLNAFGGKLPTESSVAAPAPGRRPPVGQGTDAFEADLLSMRELDILTLLQKRLTDKEIAQCLFISHHTVKKHTTNIYRKMNVSGRREAVAAAKKIGILLAK